MALRTARALVLLAAGALAAGTILGFARGSWIAALAESFRWHYVLAGVPVLALAGISRARLAAALAAVAVVTNAVVVAPLVADRPAAAGPLRLELGHVNMQSQDADDDALIAAIRRERPDAIVILDVGERTYDRLRDGVDGYRAFTRWEGGPAVMLLARRPVTGVRQPFTDGMPPSVLAFRLRVGDLGVHVLAVHPPSPGSPEDARARDAGLRAAAALSAAEEGPRVVLGDLNAAPWSRALERATAAGGLVDSARGRFPQATWPGGLGWFGLPIDGLLHSREFTVVDRRVGPSFGSEHRSLWVTLAVAEGEAG